MGHGSHKTAQIGIQGNQEDGTLKDSLGEENLGTQRFYFSSDSEQKLRFGGPFATSGVKFSQTNLQNYHFTQNFTIVHECLQAPRGLRLGPLGGCLAPVTIGSLQEVVNKG